MKKCFMMTMGLLVSFAARAAITIDVTIERPDKDTVVKSCALNEVAQFEENGIVASLVSTQKEDGTIALAAQCSRKTEEGETLHGEVADVPLALNETVTLIQTEQVTVTVVAHDTADAAEATAQN